MTELSLHKIEKKILQSLVKHDEIDIDTLALNTNLSLDNVRRGIEWLKYKGLVSVSTSKDSVIQLISEKSNDSSPKNKKDNLINLTLPERRIVDSIKNKGQKTIKIGDLAKTSKLSNIEFSVGIQNALRNGWLTKVSDSLNLTENSEKLSNEEALLEKISNLKKIKLSQLADQELRVYSLLKKRPGYLKETVEKSFDISLTDEGKKVGPRIKSDEQDGIGAITVEILNNGKWKNEKFTEIDVSSPVRSYAMGRTHPLTDIISEIREIFISMGFSEIEGSTIQSCFWNFDVLFTPQDHPARDMQDTFYISNLTDENIDPIISKKVSNFHATEWNYDWDIEKSKQTVLRTHTTPVTVKYLSESKLTEGRIFSIGRVFRNEKMSYKHLMEFHQIEGIVIGKSVNLRDLMGLQKQFYSKLGLNKVKFWPTYFPYTEPSLQSMVYIDKLGKWVELFGMGMFRPEVTQSVGITNNVLAWGGGLERIAMIRYGLDDVRELYDNKLTWLRMQPICPL
ncbi:MAG TPA: phenylalanine--tRNA ligase subunit alpha [Nitrososphaeraceae archaeon]|nr:phenylalanine--tRNA ligase subunit alpha [Nitrososphaeraceae archaeon]